ncbi:MAG TPA: sn-glycerol-3-phosphate ABC transporter ATP-binding protein UgpC [Casimicrobiaceae bacterium]|nr:sn-glycerol-3-phosphate ABC transporter ATP-binding protein UgpC [Casimicrobiaceae bacterium]
MSEVTLKQVFKSYGATEVIHGVDLAVQSGEFVVFVGPSGCGKSTLLRMIAGLEDISSGEISIGGTVVNDLPPRSRDIAMVFQDYALYPHKSVFENMAFGLRLRKRPEREVRSRVSEAAAVLQISHLLERKPRELSGGQRQRVAMGRAIVRQPKAFLFDEPLSNLDALLRAEMRVEIKRLHQRLGNTVVYVTHDQVEAMTLADRIVVLQSGNVIQYDTPDGIYNRPAAKFVAGFTGSPPMNFVVCRVGEAGRVLHLSGGVDLPVPPSRIAECARHVGRLLVFGLRPEHIAAGAPRDATSAAVAARVMLVEPLGSDTLGLVRLGGQEQASEITGRFPPDAGLAVGQNLTVSLAMNRFHLFDADSGVAIRAPDW